jgi:hypothetical protein
MLIDCDTCRAPAHACRDCVMTTLLRRPAAPVDLDDDERAALGSLAGAGLLPPLRLVVGLDGGFDADPATDSDRWRDLSGSPGPIHDIA